ncbi:MAG: undecaprenyl-diphosphate phosphatase [Treponema sp.]|jgi:undecaprenyl-diphosphatase|nr:undecaprenyl-diphosphate phosphatase [Treponema sp.]
MNIIKAVILGIVQGLTEFLPVSSSGHLVLIQKIFGITAPALFFDTMLHAGTLLAVFTCLWRDIWNILRKLIQPLTGFLVLSTIPAVAAALLFGDIIEDAFESGQFLGVCFLTTSALLVIAELLSAKRHLLCRSPEDVTKRADSGKNSVKAENMNWLDAIIIGIMQAVAIIPGISRSGATISGALSRKLDRDFAARFSFLLSIPAILGAVVLQTKETITNNAAAEAASESISAATVVAGATSAAIVGFLAMKLMFKIIREKSLYGFAIYTAVLGILILVDQFITHLVF